MKAGKLHLNFEAKSRIIRCGLRKCDVNFTSMINLVTCKSCLRWAKKDGINVV